MIVEGLLSLVQWLLSFLLSPFEIPELPAGVSDALQTVADYIRSGLAIVAASCHWDFVKSIFFASIAVEGVMLGYKFICWLLKKIPVAGVS